MWLNLKATIWNQNSLFLEKIKSVDPDVESARMAAKSTKQTYCYMTTYTCISSILPSD